jgi:hypothetical protein
LEAKSSQENNNYLGGLEFFLEVVTLKKINLLGGCRLSRKLLSLAVATFSWLFSKLSLVIVFLAASL